MTKVLSFLIIAVMALHIIRPLGFPGLRRRKDVWKIAVGALAAFMVVVLIRPE